MKSILLTNSVSRIEFECVISKQPFLIWVDTGSPNTLISGTVKKQLNLDPNKGQRFNVNIVGGTFKKAPSVTIPAINIQNKLELKNIVEGSFITKFDHVLIDNQYLLDAEFEYNE